VHHFNFNKHESTIRAKGRRRGVSEGGKRRKEEENVEEEKDVRHP